MKDADQLFFVEWLDDPSCCTGVTRALLQLGGALGRQCKDGNALVVFPGANGFYEAEAIHPGHVDIGDDDLGVHRIHDLKTMDAILCKMHLETGFNEREADHVAHGS